MLNMDLIYYWGQIIIGIIFIIWLLRKIANHSFMVTYLEHRIEDLEKEIKRIKAGD